KVKLASELSYFHSREPFIQTPEQKMGTHVLLLQDRKKTDKKELDAIRDETDWVLSDKSKAQLEARGKARYVQGLVLRNREDFAAAKAAFDEALKMVQPLEKVGAWGQLAKNSRQELIDPNAYYVPRMHKFLDEGTAMPALVEVNLALK